jgi:hypothetical protein
LGDLWQLAEDDAISGRVHNQNEILALHYDSKFEHGHTDGIKKVPSSYKFEWCRWVQSTPDVLQQLIRLIRLWKDNRQSDPLMSALGKERYVTDFGGVLRVSAGSGQR